jgi:hypothetical protein
MELVTIREFSSSIGRAYSVVRERIILNAIYPVSSKKVATRSHAFLYNKSQLLGIKFRRKNIHRAVKK